MNEDQSKMRTSTLVINPYRGPGGRWALGALLGMAMGASLLSSGCTKNETAEAAPTVTVQVGAAENQTIERKVIAEATLYPLEQAAIIPKVTAPIKKFYVERGSKVQAGQLLAELEDQDLLAAKMATDGAYAQAEAGYQQAVAKAQQDLKLAKQQLDSAQKLYDSRQSLYKEGAASSKDVSDADIALTQARNTYDLAQKQLDLKIAEGQLTSAQGNREGIEASLNYTKIVSPIDGVVTDRPLYPGETASNSGPVITVMNVSQVIAKAHIDQQEAATLKVGDAATISVPGQPGSVKGKVSLSEPSARSQQHDGRGLGSGAESGRAAEAGKRRAGANCGAVDCACHRHSGGGPADFGGRQFRDCSG